MNLYLDDDTADRRLVALLSNAGHVVVVPVEVHLSGAPDTHHFIHAMRQSLVLVTKNQTISSIYIMKIAAEFVCRDDHAPGTA